MMLNRGGNDVIPHMLIGVSYSLYGKVICLCPSAGEDDLITLGTDKSCNLFPCLLYSSLRFLSKGVNARRIAKGIAEIGQHRLYHLRMCWRSSGIVKVYSFHSQPSTMSPITGSILTPLLVTQAMPCSISFSSPSSSSTTQPLSSETSARRMLVTTLNWWLRL